MSHRSFWLAAIALVLFGLAWAVPALSQIQKDFVFSGDELTVANMIGKVEVGSAAGKDFTVEVRVMGSDATDDWLDFDVTEGREASLLIQFPLEEHDEYVYPALGRHGRTTISYREDQDQDESWIKRVLSGITCKRVTVRGRGDGLEVWADITIGVPDGGSLVVVDRVGEIRAKGISCAPKNVSGQLLAIDRTCFSAPQHDPVGAFCSPIPCPLEFIVYSGIENQIAQSPPKSFGLFRFCVSQ